MKFNVHRGSKGMHRPHTNRALAKPLAESTTVSAGREEKRASGSLINLREESPERVSDNE